MKIIYKQGDLLECTEKVIVHGCNAQGVMGSGVALAIRNKYPDAAKMYFNEYRSGKLTLGSCNCSKQPDERIIVNAVTQQFYGRNPHIIYADYNAIANVFQTVNNWAVMSNITSIAIPKIGAGLANGDWSIIEKIIEEECIYVQPVCYVL